MVSMVKTFYQAVMENNYRLVEHLIYEKKVTAKELNFIISGDSIMNFAVHNNNFELVCLFAKNGAKINSKKLKICPLFLAIKLGLVKMVSLLIDLGASIKEGWVSDRKMVPLHFAIICKNVDIVMNLIDKGANVNAKDFHSSETALHILANFIFSSKNEQQNLIQLKIAKLLLENGAEIDARDCGSRSPLDCAILLENTKLCQLLITEGVPVKRIQADGVHYEYLENMFVLICPELTRLCLERGCDFTISPKKSGLTPYHGALHFGNPLSVKEFLKFSCPFDLPVSYSPMLPFTTLIKVPNEENEKFLNTQKKFIQGIQSNNLDLVLQSLAEGAEPRGCSMNIPSTLHHLAHDGNPELVKLLLNNGVPVNTINLKGETPLQIAIKNRNVATFKLLLQFGAVIDSSRSNRPYAKEILDECIEIGKLLREIDICFDLVEKGNVRIFERLEKQVLLKDIDTLLAMMNCANRKGNSLLGLALEKGHTRIVVGLMKIRLQH